MDVVNSPLIVGFLASFALIAAIGAQNAFVLRQGIRGEHVLPVVAMCLSDIVLIAAGIAGVGTLIGAHPGAIDVAKFGGAAVPRRLRAVCGQARVASVIVDPSDATPRDWPKCWSPARP